MDFIKLLNRAESYFKHCKKLDCKTDINSGRSLFITFCGGLDIGNTLNRLDVLLAESFEIKKSSSITEASNFFMNFKNLFYEIRGKLFAGIKENKALVPDLSHDVKKDLKELVKDVNIITNWFSEIDSWLSEISFYNNPETQKNFELNNAVKFIKLLKLRLAKYN